MKLRPLILPDLPSVMLLEHSIPDNAAWAAATKKDQAAIITKGNNFGIFNGDQLVGKVGFFDTHKEGWEIDGLIVDARFRGKKYGSRLFDFAIRAITTKEHPEQFILYTHPENSYAIAMYLRRGFIIREWIQDKYGSGKHRIKLTKSFA